MTHGIGSWLRLLIGFVLVTLSFSAAALTCATPGKDGAGGVLNAPINRPLSALGQAPPASPLTPRLARAPVS